MYNINRTHMILNGTIHNVYKTNHNKIVKKTYQSTRTKLNVPEAKTKHTES